MAKAGRRKAQSPISLAGKIRQPDVMPMPHTVEEKHHADGTVTKIDRGAVIPLAAYIQAGANPVCNMKTRNLGIVQTDVVNREGMIRVTQAPLQWLAARRMLHPGDRPEDIEKNGLMREAGERYYRHWFDGGLKGIGAQNLDRVFGGEAEPAYLTPASEYAAQHRLEYREARERMGSWLAKVTDAVVCEELTLADAGSFVGDYASSKTRSAIALTMLKAGLTTLVEHFGISPVRSGKIRHWRD
jgi:hypothetical protein